jgi:glycosyltransferase involved in cell wall biosynthesis
MNPESAQLATDDPEKDFMKIARFIARLNVGGPAIHVTLVTDELRKRGYEGILAAGNVPPGEGDMEYYAAEHQVEVTRIPELVRPLSPKNDLIALWKICRLLRREKPDIVHTHTAKAGTLGRIAAILAGTPVLVHTFHGNIFDGYFSAAKTRLFLAVERFLAHFTDRIIAVSATQRSELANRYKIAPIEKIQVVQLGIDLETFSSVPPLDKNRQSESARYEEDRESRHVVIGWVGRFVEVKDPLLFIEFANQLKASSPQARFVMVGDGPMRDVIERKIDDHGLREFVKISGWKRNMADVYREIDFLVLTSLNEGTPVAILESMASGRPFVATNVGGMPDLMCGIPLSLDGFDIHANGVLVHTRKISTLTEAATILMGDASRRITMGAAGQQFVSRRFGKERLADELENLYVTILNGTTHTRALTHEITRTKNA